MVSRAVLEEIKSKYFQQSQKCLKCLRSILYTELETMSIMDAIPVDASTKFDPYAPIPPIETVMVSRGVEVIFKVFHIKSRSEYSSTEPCTISEDKVIQALETKHTTTHDSPLLSALPFCPLCDKKLYKVLRRVIAVHPAREVESEVYLFTHRYVAPEGREVPVLTDDCTGTRREIVERLKERAGVA